MVERGCGVHHCVLAGVKAVVTSVVRKDCVHLLKPPCPTKAASFADEAVRLSDINLNSYTRITNLETIHNCNSMQAAISAT